MFSTVKNGKNGNLCFGNFLLNKRNYCLKEVYLAMWHHKEVTITLYIPQVVPLSILGRVHTLCCLKEGPIPLSSSEIRDFVPNLGKCPKSSRICPEFRTKYFFLQFWGHNWGFQLYFSWNCPEFSRIFPELICEWIICPDFPQNFNVHESNFPQISCFYGCLSPKISPNFLVFWSPNFGNVSTERYGGSLTRYHIQVVSLTVLGRAHIPCCRKQCP